MEDTLKDARLLHRSLIAAAAVLCVFALSSPSDVNFGAIKRSLQRLQKLDTRSLKDAVDTAQTSERNKLCFFQKLQTYNATSPPVRLAPRNFHWNQDATIENGERVIKNQ